MGIRPTCEQFLRAAGHTQVADLWQYRNASLEMASVSGEGSGKSHAVTFEISRPGSSAALRDARRLSVTTPKSAPDTLSFADRGKQIDIYPSTDRAVVLAALQVASQKWGVLTVTGPTEFQFLCAELAREHGFRIQNLPVSPAIIQQERAVPER